MEKGKARRMFPGSNTGEGFFSYYRYILPQRKAEHIFCVKGGPGVGKSTFMASVSETLAEKGTETEYLHCSSDPDSLDGVVFPQLKVAIIDGTAPHVTDPVNPGAVDEIINLGDCWDENGIKKHRDAIIDINEDIGRMFRRAYRYLGAAKHVMDDIKDICGAEHAVHSALSQARHISECEFEGIPQSSGPGGKRNMFASAITPSGIVHHIETLFDSTYKVYLITNNWGAGVGAFLSGICGEAEARGLFTERFYCPMEPAEKIEHVIIPELKIALLSENNYIDIKAKPDAIVDLTQYDVPGSLTADREDMRFGESEFDTLLGEAIFTLRRAKETHDELERLYVPNMDFDKVESIKEKTLERIMRYLG